MKQLNKALESFLSEKAPVFSRFQVFIKGQDGHKKTVGMAYLREEQTMYTVKLWTFSNEKYFLLPRKDDPTAFLVMTREPVKNTNSKNKYFWNIVGNAKANSAQSVLEISLDLLDKKIFMSLFPELMSAPTGWSSAEGLDLSA